MDSADVFSFPKKVPLFPLPNVILFPYLDLPLYIFEPRYRKMLQDVLNSDRLMAIVLEPYPTYDVCGVGMVKFAAENEDGTSHIILSGMARAKIKKIAQQKPYLIAEIDILNDDVTHSNEEMALTEKIKELFIRKEKMTKIVTEEHIQNIEQIEDPSRLCDIITFFSMIAFAKKQKVLEALNVLERLRVVLKNMEEEIGHLESKN